MGKFYEGLGAELSLYVKQLAWLNTVPEKSSKSRLDVLDDKPDMPPCLAMHIVDYLFEVGPTMPSGMGAVPITNGELSAWQSNKGILLNAWEAKVLRTLSIEYIHQTMLSKEPACPAPYGKAEARQITAKTMRESIRELAKT